jgi:ribonuclease HI
VVDAVLTYQVRSVVAEQKKKGQLQYETTFEPSLVPVSYLPIIEAGYPGRYSLGSRVLRSTALTCQHAGPHTNCDACLGAEGRIWAQDCTTCGKWWHSGCLTAIGDYRPRTDCWDCVACAADTGTPASRQAQAADVWLTWVHWTPSWEKAEPLRSLPGGPRALAHFLTESANAASRARAAAQAKARGVGPRPDDGLKGDRGDLRQNPAARNTATKGDEGEEADESRSKTKKKDTWIATAGHPVRANVSFVHSQANPHLDTHPTGSPQLAVRDVQLWKEGPKPNTPGEMGDCRQLAISTNSDGRATGTLTPAHLQVLRDRFEAAKAAGVHATIAPPACSFETEVASLMMRCGAKDRDEEWTVAPGILGAFASAFGVSCEHVASPLLAHPRHGTYTTPHPRDAIFGADTGAFAHPWAGVHAACVGPDHAAMDRAFRWALASAMQLGEQGEASATVLFLRAGTKGAAQSAFNKYPASAPHMCTKLATLDGGTALAGRATWATGGEPKGAQGIQVWLIWNAQAAYAWRNRCSARMLLASTGPAPEANSATTWALDTLKKEAAEAGGKLSLGEHPMDPPVQATATVQRPNGFGRARLAPPANSNGAAGPVPRGSDVLQLYASPEHLNRLPLRWDWRAMAYADGSAKDNFCGAGLWLPPDAVPDGPHGPAAAARTLTIDPAGEGPTNTITRAELSAIWAALKQGATTIASDSACALWLLQRAVRDPNSLRKNRLHRPLVLAILAQLQAAPAPVQLIKVKAHTGVVGNELADQAAAVARANVEAGSPCDMACSVAPHELARTYWPCTRPEKPLAGADDKPHYLPNIKDAVGEHMRAEHGIGGGGAAEASWRFSRFQANLKAGLVLPTPSNGYMTSSRVKHSCRRCVQKARTGTLFHQGTAKLFGYCESDTCTMPGCGLRDGITHMLGGCQNASLRGMFQERHNDLGRLLLAAVAEGAKGAALGQTDVGRRAKLEAVGLPEGLLPEAQRYIPRNMLPTSLTKAEWRALRPDGLLAWTDKNGGRHVRVIELKVTSDLDPARALKEASAQHEALLTHLRNPRDRANVASAELAPITFGATGVAFSATRTTLMGLGVPKECADTAIEGACLALANWTHKIVRVRRALEGPHRPPQQVTRASAGTKRRRVPSSG